MLQLIQIYKICVVMELLLKNGRIAPLFICISHEHMNTSIKSFDKLNVESTIRYVNETSHTKQEKPI